MSRKVLFVDLAEKTHEAFKLKCGNRNMKDRVRQLIRLDIEGKIIIKNNDNN